MAMPWSKSDKSPQRPPPPHGAAPPGGGGSSPPPPVAPPPPEPGLTIECPTLWPLERDGQTIRLPEVKLVPTNRDLPPDITSLRITGVSTNPKLAAWLTQAFQAVCSKPPSRLAETVVLKPSPVPWPDVERITSPADQDLHHLQIVVSHRPRLATTNRPSETPLAVEAAIRLFIGGTLAPTHTLTVQPKHLVKVYEEDDDSIGPRLTIRLEQKSRPAVPPTDQARGRAPVAPPPATQITIVPQDAKELKTLTASWGCPLLVTTIENLFNQIQGSARRLPDGQVVIQLRPQFALSPAERRALNERQRQPGTQPLYVPFRVLGTGAVPVQMTLELIPLEKSNVQQGKITCDLGTSSSLAVRFDPRYIKRTIFPREQLDQLAADLVAFLDDPPKDLLAAAQSHWLRLFQAVCAECELDGSRDPVKAVGDRLKRLTFSSERDQESFFEVLRQIELRLWSMDCAPEEERKLARFQELVADRMHAIYHVAYEKVTLEQWGVHLSTTAHDTPFTVSELELRDVVPLPSGEMGAAVAQRRIEWLAGKKPAPAGRLTDGRFLECPKRFQPHLHEDIDITELDAWPVRREGEDARVHVTPRQVLQASWLHLIEKARGQSAPGDRGISEVCLTYPADLMPEPRGELEEALHEIGMTNVYLLFDESTAPAIFHLEQFLGNLEEIGCEAFKVACVKEGTIWTHHMLVFDLGAGTTDISLIRLELEEVRPARSEFGGRLYIIRPRLLGAAGRHFSGGHQLTLKMFRVLKQLLAKWILRSTDPTSVYTDDGIVLDAERGDDPQMTQTLDRAETVIPTRFYKLHEMRQKNLDGGSPEWAAERRKLERFHLLWNWAERLKIYLSKLTTPVPKVPLAEALPEGFTRLQDVLRKLLEGGPHAAAAGPPGAAPVAEANPTPARGPEFSVEHFQNLARIAVERSVRLATAMARSALESYGEKVKTSLSLQSLVLSGRASALPEVTKQFREKLQGPTLGVSPDRILFRTEYAKSATAIGAWRGLHRWLSGKEYVGKPQALNGKCELDIQVQNLFYFLPASYRIGTAANELGESIFTRYSEFRQHGTQPLGIIRDPRGFITPDREVSIYRDDGDGDGVLCGRLVKGTLPERLGNRVIDGRDPRDEVKTWQVRYEINHQRKLYALLIRPSTPPGKDANPVAVPIYDVSDKDENPYTVVNVEKRTLEALAKAQGVCPFHVDTEPPEPGRTPLVPADKWQPIRCLAARATGDPATPPKLVDGWMGPALATLVPTREGKLNLYFLDAKSNQPVQPPAVVTPKPKKRGGPAMDGNRFPFEVRYRIVVTADGRCALVVGDEPAYWETTDIYEWLTSPEGRIFRTDLTPLRQEHDWWRDHLSGRH